MTTEPTTQVRSRHNRSTTVAGLLTVATLLAVTPLAAAVAAPTRGGGNTVRAHGGCTASAVWKLSAKHDNGAVEVEYEVDSNVVGQVWTVRLKDNGQRFFAGKRTTAGASGSFTVRKLTGNRAGDDVIRARAVHGTQVCRGTVTV